MSRQDFPACEECPLRGPQASGKGDPKSPIVFVAESPGRDEVRAGRPLVGASGKIFHQIVPQDKGYYILNAMNCFPSPRLKQQHGEKITAQCARACNDRLIREVSAHPRKIIIAMGNAAQWSLTGNYGLKITQTRGSLLPSPYAELGIFPVVHIAGVMKGTGNLNQWIEDVQYALHLGEGGEFKQHLKAQVIPMVGLWQEPSKEMLDKLFFGRKTNKVTGDIETSDLHYMRGRILTFGVTFDDELYTSYCFYPHQIPLLRPYLESPDLKWCWHNGGFDVQWFRHHYGIQARTDDDTMLMSYTLDESQGIHDLETISGSLLGAPDYKHMISPWLPNKNTSYDQIPLDVLGEYQAIDTSNTAQIRPILRERIKGDSKLEHLYTEVLIPAREMLTRVEGHGFYIDQDRLEENRKYYIDQQEKSTRDLVEIAGRQFSPGSPQQVADVMFDTLCMPHIKKRSTDKEVIAKLLEKPAWEGHPFLRGLKEHREAVKMFGTYVKGMTRHIMSDGRIHPTYKIHGTRTGRLSCANPNLQNIPRLARLKSQFAAAPGHYLMDIDLSQGELRVLACASQDENLVRVFNEGRDIHTELCLHLWGDQWDSWDKTTQKERRVKAKNTNFGIPYGIGKYGLADQIRDTPDAAQEMLDAWDSRYPTARKFLNKCRATAGTNKTITTSFGRKKRPVIVTRENEHFIKNEAANFPIQSMCSDITLVTAIRVWKELLEGFDVKIINLVHDSIIFEVPETQQHNQKEIIERVTHQFSQVPRDYGLTQVPFISDAEIGYRWGNLEAA